MSSTIHRLGFVCWRCSNRIPARRKPSLLVRQVRQLHCSPRYQAQRKHDKDADEDEDSEQASSSPEQSTSGKIEPFRFNLDDLSSKERTLYLSLPPDQQEQFRFELRTLHEYYTQPEVAQTLQGEISKAASEPLMPLIEPEKPRFRPGLLAMGEDEPEDVGEDPEFEGDDITALGHGELEQHREMREYARIAVWEMPLLSSSFPPSPFFPFSLSHSQNIDLA